MIVKITEQNNKVYLSGDKEALDILKALCTYVHSTRLVLEFIHIKAEGEEGFFEASDGIRFVRHKFYTDTPIDTEINGLIDTEKIKKLKKGDFEIELESFEYIGHKYPDTDLLLNSFTFPNQLEITLPEDLFKTFYYLDKSGKDTGCIFTKEGIKINKTFVCKKVDGTVKHIDTELNVKIPLEVKDKFAIRAKYLHEFFQYYRKALRWQLSDFTLKIQYNTPEDPIRLVILPPEEVYYIVMPLKY